MAEQQTYDLSQLINRIKIEKAVSEVISENVFNKLILSVKLLPQSLTLKVLESKKSIETNSTQVLVQLQYRSGMKLDMGESLHPNTYNLCAEQLTNRTILRYYLTQAGFSSSAENCQVFCCPTIEC